MYYVLNITYYQLLISTYLLLERKNMNLPKTLIDPNFTHEGLSAFQGYSLQLFGSGRIKLTLQTQENKTRSEYYADAPKRDMEAYKRQKNRSGDKLAQHFNLVDRLIAEQDDTKVFRVHEKGDNNATADNAHVITSVGASSVFCVFDDMCHTWRFDRSMLARLYAKKGARKGVSSYFNEYVATYEHDWEDVSFDFKATKSRLKGEAMNDVF
jgi:hypothetical protein